MGLGDNLMATGMARGASARGVKIAFGDKAKGEIRWDPHSDIIFRNNPNIAPRYLNRGSNLEWIAFYKGHRIYNRQGNRRWIWNYEFKAIPGEIFLTADERARAARVGTGFVVIEPTVPSHKSVAPNKQWPVERYEQLAARLAARGHDVLQMVHKDGVKLKSARLVKTADFRAALANLARAKLYIGPEGGLHHGAAAVGIPAVVLFGGFIPPAVTGYDTHTNLTGGAVACGSFLSCDHCRAAMLNIGVDEAEAAALKYLEKALVV